MIMAVVGSGGKTTLIKKYAERYLRRGLKVLVNTSTHMAIEKDALITDDPGIIIKALDENHYVMAGRMDGEKLGSLSENTYNKVCEHADIVLTEADGSNRKPVKFPASYEPVIYDNVDRIIIVCGLHALGRKVEEAAHRPELVKNVLDISDDTAIVPFHIQTLVKKGYVEPLKKKYPKKEIVIEPSHDGSAYQRHIAALIKADINVETGGKIGCILMASGLGKRFGSNKLLAKFREKTMMETALDITDGDIFARRIVVTRSREVEDICKKFNVDVIFHQLPGRNDAVALGIKEMADMDACLFCPCDQPFLRRESIGNLMRIFSGGGTGICRLSYGKEAGAPILFAKRYFSQLADLPPKTGGSYLVEKYKNDVSLVKVKDKIELYDIDTHEDLIRAEKAAESRCSADGGAG